MTKSFTKYTIIYLFFLFVVIFMSNDTVYSGVKLKDDAVSYRKMGYEAQERGDIDDAISWYQKSASLDINYAAPHNDLGILYEAKGWLDRAELSYKKALAIDPNYEKAHTNLALFYERKGEPEKASFFWMKRYKLGNPNDLWTQEAKKKLIQQGLLDEKEEAKILKDTLQQREADDIKGPTKDKKKEDTKKEASKKDSKKDQKDTSGWARLGSKKEKPASAKKEKKISEAEEKEAKKDKKKASKEKSPKPKKETAKKKKAEAIKKTDKKDIDKELEKSLKLAEERLKKGKKSTTRTPKKYKEKAFDSNARSYYLSARNYYKNGEHAKALNTIRAARKNYPEDASLMELEKSIKNKMKEERIGDHYKEGIMLYRQNDYKRAKKEFEAILNILPE
ncbi:MAG: tetratricopeptide repeat protein [Candidatus Omnitrophota bacterium]